MVKPPKTMQPEQVNTNEKAPGAFEEGSFHHYMARKIDLQRQQFGVQLPPEPEDSENQPNEERKKRKKKRTPLEHVLKKLKQRHGRAPKTKKQKRTDLFFQGIVVLINGYTNPDASTLQRLLHQHGGDVEKYETTRVTHVLAEQLSSAKANSMRLPVCHPKWIMDSIQAQKRLPEADYLVIRDKEATKITSFWQRKETPDDDAKPAANVSIRESPAQPDDDTKPAANVSIRKPTAQPLPVFESMGNPREKSAESAAQAQVASMPLAASEPLPSGSRGASETITSSIAPRTPTAISRTDNKYIDGKLRTVGTDPHFLQSFFANSRLSFIGSYKQRAKQSPTKKRNRKEGRRYVMHIDMDCFFANVALRRYPQYRSQPVVIAHGGTTDKKSSSECSTCNYLARDRGIRKGMYLGKARELCPELVVLPYDFEGYEEVSEAVTAILDRYADEYDGYVEHVSCDEAYMEVYYDGPHADMGRLADAIRRDILEETQCTATVGVAGNKLMAKLGTDKVKPNGSIVVEEPGELLRSLKLRDLHGVGYRMERKLAQNQLVAVKDVWDLGASGEDRLRDILGPALGKKIFLFCNGEDDRPVESSVRKTIGAECNYGVRFDGPYGVDYMIRGLAEEVERRMESAGILGKTVTIRVKQRKEGAPPPPKFLGHGSCHNLSKSITISAPTRSASVFLEKCVPLFLELEVDPCDVRGMGISVSNLVDIANARKGDKDIRSWMTGAKATRSSEGGSEPEYEKTAATNAIGTADVPIDILSSGSVDSLPEVDGSSPNGRDDANLVDCDIQIPSASQIHMSQVDFLPSPLRRAVTAKVIEASKPRDVISMLSFKDPSKKRKKGYLSRRVSFAAETAVASKAENQDEPIAFGVTDTCDNDTFFDDNTKPFGIFLDENLDASDEAQDAVVQFLSILVEEDRLWDVVVLLRSMRNRTDKWSTLTIDPLLHRVNEVVQRLQEFSLDEACIVEDDA